MSSSVDRLKKDWERSKLLWASCTYTASHTVSIIGGYWFRETQQSWWNYTVKFLFHSQPSKQFIYFQYRIYISLGTLHMKTPKTGCAWKIDLWFFYSWSIPFSECSPKDLVKKKSVWAWQNVKVKKKNNKQAKFAKIGALLPSGGISKHKSDKFNICQITRTICVQKVASLFLEWYSIRTARVWTLLKKYNVHILLHILQVLLVVIDSGRNNRADKITL